MKRLLLAFILIVIGAAVAAGQTRERLSGWCERVGQQVFTDGRPSTTRVQRSFQSCKVRVLINGTGTPATIYSDYAGTPQSNPFFASTLGYWDFVADAGRYDLE